MTMLVTGQQDVGLLGGQIRRADPLTSKKQNISVNNPVPDGPMQLITQSENLVPIPVMFEGHQRNMVSFVQNGASHTIHEHGSGNKVIHITVQSGTNLKIY